MNVNSNPYPYKEPENKDPKEYLYDEESWLEYDPSQTFLTREALLAAIRLEEEKEKEKENEKDNKFLTTEGNQ